MARADVIKPYVEKLLKEFFKTDTLTPDQDGDWAGKYGSSVYYVRLADGDPPIIGIWSSMVTGVTVTAELLQAINDINAQIRFARVWAGKEAVLVAHELIAETLDQQELTNACLSIAGIADRWDTELVQRSGAGRAWRIPSPPATSRWTSDRTVANLLPQLSQELAGLIERAMPAIVALSGTGTDFVATGRVSSSTTRATWSPTIMW